MAKLFRTSADPSSVLLPPSKGLRFLWMRQLSAKKAEKVAEQGLAEVGDQTFNLGPPLTAILLRRGPKDDPVLLALFSWTFL